MILAMQISTPDRVEVVLFFLKKKRGIFSSIIMQSITKSFSHLSHQTIFSVSAKKVLYPSASFAFITLFSRDGPSIQGLPLQPPVLSPSPRTNSYSYVNFRRTALLQVSTCNKISSMTIYYDFLTWINEILTIQQQEHFRHY